MAYNNYFSLLTFADCNYERNFFCAHNIFESYFRLPSDARLRFRLKPGLLFLVRTSLGLRNFGSETKLEIRAFKHFIERFVVNSDYFLIVSGQKRIACLQINSRFYSDKQLAQK